MTTTHFDTPARSWSLLDSLSHLGTGLVSFFARENGGGSGGGTEGGTGGYGPEQALSVDVTAASSEPLATPAEMACCNLEYPNGPFCDYTGSPQNYVCPDGWYRQWWFCCQGTQQAGCGECTRDPNTCWGGPWLCSIWWWTGQSC